MDKKQSHLQQLLREVQKFLVEHGANLGAVIQSGMRVRFDQAIADISEAAATQSSSAMAAKSATARQQLLIRTLLDHHMAHIACIAAVELPALPDLAVLSMPKARETRERLVAAARGMATEAAKYSPMLIAAGMAPDFVAELKAATDAVENAITERKQRQADHRGATEVLAKRLSHCRKMLRALDRFVKTAAQDDAGLLAAWKLVKRIGHPATSTKAPTAPAAAVALTNGGGVEQDN